MLHLNGFVSDISSLEAEGAKRRLQGFSLQYFTSKERIWPQNFFTVIWTDLANNPFPHGIDERQKWAVNAQIARDKSWGIW